MSFLNHLQKAFLDQLASTQLYEEVITRVALDWKWISFLTGQENMRKSFQNKLWKKISKKTQYPLFLKGRDQKCSCGLGEVFFLFVPLIWCISSLIIQKIAPGRAASFKIGSMLKNQELGIFVMVYLRDLAVGKGSKCTKRSWKRSFLTVWAFGIFI